MHRRTFFKSTGIALFAASFGGVPAFLRRAAAHPQDGPGRRKVLVTIFQRGAMDGLMAVTPYDDAAYRTARPHLAMSTGPGNPALSDLDGRFGLHPGFAPLLPLFKEGRLGIVHAVGSPDNTRSHFEAQDYMETGTPGVKGTPTGWLNRAAGMLDRGTTASPFRAVSITSALPRSLYGDAPSLAIADLSDFRVGIPGTDPVTAKAGKSFETLYEQTSQKLLRGTGRETFEATRMIAKLDPKKYRPAPEVVYPRSPAGKALEQVAQLIKADVGLEIAFVESGGWDTHVGQGTDRGNFARTAQDLALSIAAFWQDIEQYHSDVTLMTMTEFGRTVAENGSGGTDHGRGSCLFVLGNDIAGGRVHGKFPESLSAEHLEDARDLPALNDFRSVFAGVAGSHLNIRNDAALFPGWGGKRMELTRR